MTSLPLAQMLDIRRLDSYTSQLSDELRQSVKNNLDYLERPLARVTGVSGKLLRSGLVLAFAGASSTKLKPNQLNACLAIELLHLASLVHDDIIDNAKTRRGTQTINYREGNNAAIIAGDYLFALSFSYAARISQEAVTIVSEAFGALCQGQAREMADLGNLKRKTSDYFKSIEGKTAALFGASCQLGVLLAGSDKSHQGLAYKYGHGFGMMFQVVDDVLDLVGDVKQLGKPHCNDVKEGNYTLPILISLSQPNAVKLRTQLQIATRQPAKHFDSGELIDLCLNSGAISKSIEQASKFADSAGHIAKSQAVFRTRHNLTVFPRHFLDWSLNQISRNYQSNLK